MGLLNLFFIVMRMYYDPKDPQPLKFESVLCMLLAEIPNIGISAKSFSLMTFEQMFLHAHQKGIPLQKIQQLLEQASNIVAESLEAWTHKTLSDAADMVHDKVTNHYIEKEGMDPNEALARADTFLMSLPPLSVK